MEQQLTNKEIARVFAMYFGSQFQFEGHLWQTKFGTIEGVGRYSTQYDACAVVNNNEVYYIPVDKGKLLLTPLDKITDEHAIEVCIIKGDNIVKSRPNLNHIIRFAKSNMEDYAKADYRVYQYLIQHHYAVPLFFGINHWANGKTAIELNIAIDKNQQDEEQRKKA